MDKTDVHYGDLTLHDEIRLLGTESFIHVPTASSSNSGVFFFSGQTQEFRCLFELTVFTDFGAKLDGLVTELEGENKTTNKMLGIPDFFKTKLYSWMTANKRCANPLPKLFAPPVHRVFH